MPPDTIWSDHQNKVDSKLSARSVEWKNLMNECLMATQIKINENSKEKYSNPNVAMSIRHQMAKKYAQPPPMPRCQIQSEAMKLIRKENGKKFLRIKEENLIKNEIEKLKQILDCHETISKKYIETDEKQKYEKPLPKVTPKNFKLWVLKVDRQYRAEKMKKIVNSKMASDKPKKVEVINTIKECVNNENYEVNLHAYNSRNDVSVKLFEEAKTEKRDMTAKEVKPISPLLDVMSQRRLKQAWETWRTYTQRQRKRERQKKIIVSKIETFLSKLQQSEKERKVIRKPSKEKPKILKRFRKVKTGISDEKLQKLMEEVKLSQAEALQRLHSRHRRVEKDWAKPSFLSRMEERREERLKRRKEIEERKQKLKEEAENVQKKQDEETRKRKEEEKQKKMEELRERRRMEKEKKEEQRKKREKSKRDQVVAKSYYRKFLLNSYGLRPWMRLIMLKEAQYQRAVDFHERRLMLYLCEWRTIVREQLEEKEKRATQLYNENLVKRSWNSWMKFQMDAITKNQAAEDWNDFKILEKMFRYWVLFTENEQSEYLDKKEMAESHYLRKLKTKCLKKLQSYPEYKKEEKETELRKLKWRQKVKEILPDYQPVEIVQKW